MDNSTQPTGMPGLLPVSIAEEAVREADAPGPRASNDGMGDGGAPPARGDSDEGGGDYWVSVTTTTVTNRLSFSELSGAATNGSLARTEMAVSANYSTGPLLATRGVLVDVVPTTAVASSKNEKTSSAPSAMLSVSTQEEASKRTGASAPFSGGRLMPLQTSGSGTTQTGGGRSEDVTRTPQDASGEGSGMTDATWRRTSCPAPRYRAGITTEDEQDIVEDVEAVMQTSNGNAACHHHSNANSGTGVALPATSRFAKCKKLPSLLQDSWEFRKIASEGSVLANALICFDVDDDGVEECVVGTTEGVLLVVKPDCRAPVFTHVLSATISVVLYSCRHRRLVLVSLEGQCEILDNFLIASSSSSATDTDTKACGGAGKHEGQRATASRPATAATAPRRTTSHSNLAVDLVTPTTHDTYGGGGRAVKPAHVFHIPSNCFCGDLGPSESGTERIFLGSYDRRMYVYSEDGVCLLSVFMHSPITSIKTALWTAEMSGWVRGPGYEKGKGHAASRSRGGTHSTSGEGMSSASSEPLPPPLPIPLVFVATTRTLALLRAGTKDFEQLRQLEAKRRHPLTLADADAIRTYRDGAPQSSQQQQQLLATAPHTGVTSIGPTFGEHHSLDAHTPATTTTSSHIYSSHHTHTAPTTAGGDSCYMVSPSSPTVISSTDGAGSLIMSPPHFASAASPQYGSHTALHTATMLSSTRTSSPTMEVAMLAREADEEEVPLSPASPQSPSHQRSSGEGRPARSGRLNGRHTESSAPVTLLHPLWLVKIAENGILAPPPLLAAPPHGLPERKEGGDTQQQQQQRRHVGGRRRQDRLTVAVGAGLDGDEKGREGTPITAHRKEEDDDREASGCCLSRHRSTTQDSPTQNNDNGGNGSNRGASWATSGDPARLPLSPSSRYPSSSSESESESESTDTSASSEPSGSRSTSTHSSARSSHHGGNTRSGRGQRRSRSNTFAPATASAARGAGEEEEASDAMRALRAASYSHMHAESVPRALLRDGSLRPSLAMIAKREAQDSAPARSPEAPAAANTAPGQLIGVLPASQRLGRRRSGAQRAQDPQDEKRDGSAQSPGAATGGPTTRPDYRISLPPASHSHSDNGGFRTPKGTTAAAVPAAAKGKDGSDTCPTTATTAAPATGTGTPLRFDDSVALSLSLDVSSGPGRMLLVASSEDGRAFVLDFSALRLRELAGEAACDERGGAGLVQGGRTGGRAQQQQQQLSRKQDRRVRGAYERGFSGNINQMYDDMAPAGLSLTARHAAHYQRPQSKQKRRSPSRARGFAAASAESDATAEQEEILAKLLRTRRRQRKAATVLHRCGNMNWDNKAPASSPKSGSTGSDPGRRSVQQQQQQQHGHRRRPCYHIYVPLREENTPAREGAGGGTAESSKTERRASVVAEPRADTPVELRTMDEATSNNGNGSRKTRNAAVTVAYNDGKEEMVVKVKCVWAGNLGGASPLVQRSRILRVAEDGFCAVLVTASGTCVAIDPDTCCAVEYAVLADCSSFTLSVGPPIPVILPAAATAAERSPPRSLSHLPAPANDRGLANTVLGRAVSCVCVCVDELSVYSIGDAFLSTVYQHHHSRCEVSTPQGGQGGGARGRDASADAARRARNDASAEARVQERSSRAFHGGIVSPTSSATGLSPFVMVEGWSRSERDEERQQLQFIGAALMAADGVLTRRQQKLVVLARQQGRATVEEREEEAEEEEERDEQVFYALKVISEGYSIEDWNTLSELERVGKVA